MAEEKKILIPGRLKNAAVGGHVAGTEDIYDDELTKTQKQINAEVNNTLTADSEGVIPRLAQLEEQVHFDGEFQTAQIPSEIVSESGKITTANAVAGALNNTLEKALENTKYFECNTSANEATKTVASSNYTLNVGGCIKIKMLYANTADNVTLTIGNNASKPLYYGNDRASSGNSWEAGETIEVYYNGTNFYANNVAGGSGDGAFDISKYKAVNGTPTTYRTLADALGTNGEHVPQSLRKGGMSVKYVQSSDNKYVQARCMAQNFTTDVTQWQGVDDTIKFDSHNLSESSAVYSGLENNNVEVTGMVTEFYNDIAIPYYNTQGEAQYGDNVIRTNLIPVKQGDVFSCNLAQTNLYLEIAAFDSDKNLVSASSRVGTDLWEIFDYTVPSGVYYVQFTNVASSTANIRVIKTNAKYAELIPSIGSDKQPTGNGVLQVCERNRVSDNSFVNLIIKELYLENVTVANISIVRFYRSVLISSKYYSGVVLYDSSYNTLATTQKSFTEKAEADNYAAKIFASSNGMYIIADLSDISEGTYKEVNPITLNKEVVNIEYSPYISNYKTQEDVNFNTETLSALFFEGIRIGNDGMPLNNSLFKSTDYINIKDSVRYIGKPSPTSSNYPYIVGYNEKREFVSVLKQSNNQVIDEIVVIPDEVSYIRACSVKEYDAKLFYNVSLFNNAVASRIDNTERSLPYSDNYIKVANGNFNAAGEYTEVGNNVVSIDYVPITSDPTIIAKSGDDSITVGKRYYDVNKDYLGSTYDATAKYVRFVCLNAIGLELSININDVAISTDRFKKCVSTEIFEDTAQSINIYNSELATFDRRWARYYESIIQWPTPGGSSSGICGSGLIPVEEGKTYTISGDGIQSWDGAYFPKTATGEIGDQQVAFIDFIVPVDGNGRNFIVPSGQNIGYIALLLKRKNEEYVINGNVMINEGELALPYQPYDNVAKIKQKYIPNVEVDDEAINKVLSSTPSACDYSEVSDKIENFKRHYLLKDKDLVVCNVGTSLTEAGIIGNTCRIKSNGAYRPPLMDCNNYASLLWNKLAWSNQYYRRYDAMSEEDGDTPMFTEVGTFASTMGIADWDDYGYKPAFTRYADATNGVSLSFEVPSNANQFNFIYRTDQIGCQSCTIAITEGNGYMEVWNGSAWVEANGHTFSMRESAVTLLPSISFINPSDGSASTLTNYQVKGNSTYQKRLKMRTVLSHRSSTKTVTISATGSGERFMYWGVEWSLRPYMITFINAARGSHNPLIQVNSEMRELNHYQDNEVWEFKPDIFITENPITNAGASGPERYTTPYWNNVTNNYFFASNSVSLKARATTLFDATYADSLEWVIFNTSPTILHSVTDNFDEKCEANLSEDYLTWLDANQMTFCWLKENHPEVIAINASKFWRETSIRLYGNLYQSVTRSLSATATSSFLADGTHWNELGCKVMAKVILGVLDMIV